MNVLSLFDGMSCGQQALERVGIKADNYFASEIDKYAIKVTMANYPNTIQLGSVVDVDGYSLPKIDLLIGGSPCQSFSFAGKRKGMSTKNNIEILTLEHYLQLKEQQYEFEGQSYLFWEYMRILKEVKPKYFLLENVVMAEKWERILSKAIGVNPILINSNLVSAQNRERLYWTNIGMKSSGLFGDMESIIEQPKDKVILLKDILQSEVDLKYCLKGKIFDKKEGAYNVTNQGKNINNLINKSHTLMARDYKGFGNQSMAGVIVNENRILGGDFRRDECFRWRENGKSGTLVAQTREDGTAGQGLVNIYSKIRRLTPIECERLQTVRDNYTNYVSDSQRYKMLGNGWTVDVIAHIFSYIEI